MDLRENAWPRARQAFKQTRNQINKHTRAIAWSITVLGLDPERTVWLLIKECDPFQIISQVPTNEMIQMMQIVERERGREKHICMVLIVLTDLLSLLISANRSEIWTLVLRPQCILVVWWWVPHPIAPITCSTQISLKKKLRLDLSRLLTSRTWF